MKKLDDINLSKIDINKHTFILKAGTILFRVIIGTYDPRIPTGQENRCAKNPNNVTPQQYQTFFLDGHGAVCGTGNVFFSLTEITASKEVKKRYSADKLSLAVAHKIILNKDIPVVDTISICSSEGVDPTPGEDQQFWHYFYGPPIRAQALKLKSSVDPGGENIVFFPDNIPDYLNTISKENAQ